MMNGTQTYINMLDVLSDGKHRAVNCVARRLRTHRKTAEEILEIAVKRGDVRKDSKKDKPVYFLDPKGLEYLEKSRMYEDFSQRLETAIGIKLLDNGLNGIKNCVKILNGITTSNGNRGVNTCRLARKVNIEKPLRKYLAFLEEEELVDSREPEESEIHQGCTKRIFFIGHGGYQFTRDFEVYAEKHDPEGLIASLKTNY